MHKKKYFGLGYMDLGTGAIMIAMGLTNGLYYFVKKSSIK